MARQEAIRRLFRSSLTSVRRPATIATARASPGQKRLRSNRTSDRSPSRAAFDAYGKKKRIGATHILEAIAVSAPSQFFRRTDVGGVGKNIEVVSSDSAETCFHRGKPGWRAIVLWAWNQQSDYFLDPAPSAPTTVTDSGLAAYVAFITKFRETLAITDTI